MLRLTRYIPMLFLAVSASQAWADASPLSFDSGLTALPLTQIPLEELVKMDVQSASKIAGQISAAPSAVSIITADDIKANGYHTLAEILESMRGLYITNDRAYSFLGGRGFGRPGDFTGRIMLLLDGTQINNNIYSSGNLEYVGIIDPSLIERVEYVSGPGSAIYGNNAFFGIINVITKQGHDINGLQVVGEVASYGGRDAKINYGKRLENGAKVLLSASGFNSDGQNLTLSQDASGNVGRALNLDEQQSRRLFGKVEWENWFAELAYSTRKKDIPTAPYGADFNAPYNYEDTMFSASLKHDRWISPALQMSLHGYYGHFEYQGLATFSSIAFKERSVGQWLGLNAQFVGNWFKGQRILFGSEVRYDFDQRIKTSALDLDTYESTLGLYAQDEIKLNQQWLINLGARFDVNQNEFNNNVQRLSPRLALTYKPFDTTNIKLSWSQAYRRPNPFEKHYTDNLTLFSNAELKPERVRATELVIEHHLDRDTRLLGALYYYQTDNVIFQKDLDASAGTSQFNNVRGGAADGAEVELEKHWDNDVRLRTSVAIQSAEDGDGRWQINAPRRIGKLNFSAPFFKRAWRVAYEMQAYSERKTERGTMLGGFSLANLTLSADDLLPNLSAAVGVRNLFDRDYAHVAPSSNDKQILIPQDGRSYWLRMTYEFK
ncbi:MAG: TonB-dependent receptor [Betaproteobacteria bacterium HGW-Betaproteobacteria-22]|nr:MAG: TonB-dependent receptor [Betaproteobacteria bacterium HGW-Betaproteobacteria-22]